MKKIIFVLILIFALSLAAACDPVKPIAMINSSIGGAALNSYTPGITDAVGLNNIGLLVKTWGKVTAVNTTGEFFYINDGSARPDTSGNVGIRVSYANLASGVMITPPAVDSYVTITAISSTVALNGNVYSSLRPRSQDDIQVVF